MVSKLHMLSQNWPCAGYIEPMLDHLHPCWADVTLDWPMLPHVNLIAIDAIAIASGLCDTKNVSTPLGRVLQVTRCHQPRWTGTDAAHDTTAWHPACPSLGGSPGSRDASIGTVGDTDLTPLRGRGDEMLWIELRPQSVHLLWFKRQSLAGFPGSPAVNLVHICVGHVSNWVRVCQKDEEHHDISRTSRKHLRFAWHCSFPSLLNLVYALYWSSCASSQPCQAFSVPVSS